MGLLSQKIKMPWEAYRKLPAGVRASFWFAVCSMLQKGIQFIVTPIFTRLLTTEQYGQFSLYQSWETMFLTVITLKLADVVFNNGMIRFDNDRDAFISAMQGLSAVSILLAFCVYLTAPDRWDSLLGLPRILVVAMFIQVFFTPPWQFWTMRQRFEYRYRALTAVTLLLAVSNPILGLIAVHLTPERGIARALSAALLTTLEGIFFCFYNLKRSKKLYVKRYWKYALAFNIPLIPHFLSQIVLAQADRIMIGKMFGKSPVAVYSLACSIGTIMDIITGSIRGSFDPWIYQRCKAQDYRRIGKVANILLALCAGIILVPILMAPEVMAIMAPGAYGEAIWTIPPLAVSSYFIFLYSLFGNIEFYFEENKFIAAASSLAAVLNVVLNWFCMHWFGYIAAGYTTLLCYVFLTAVHYCLLRRAQRKHGVKERIYDMRVVCGITLAVCVVAALCMPLYPHPRVRYGLLLVGAVVVWRQRRSLLDLLKSLKR